MEQQPECKGIDKRRINGRFAYSQEARGRIKKKKKTGSCLEKYRTTKVELKIENILKLVEGEQFWLKD